MTLRTAPDQHKNYGVRAFLWGLALAACIVIPIMIYDKGYFLYYGDFNAQQIPFYQLAHDSIQSGNTGWSHLTDLGANFVGSYSFYLLGSPFFLLTLLLPSAAVPYAMGPLLMLKLGCAALTGYIYLRRHVRDRRYAVIGGLLYAFSSFSVYNIFFFHFHEAIIIFPLLLAAVDEYHYTGRRGLVSLAVCASAVLNYYFFFGQAVFVFIYWLIRIITKGYRFRIKTFLIFAGECIIGLLMSMFLLLPSIAAVTGNFRLTEIVNGWGALVYGNAKRYVQLLVALFFPGDIPARLNFTPEAGGQWSSIAAYLPMVSMVFVIAYARMHKRSFTRIILIVSAVMALIPGLNSMFQAMNSSYYARWFYMPTLMLTMATVKSLDDLRHCRFKKGFIPTAVITGVTALLIGLMPHETFRNSVTTMYEPGIEDNPPIFWLFVGISAAGLIATALLYLLYKKKTRYFYRALALSLSVFIVGYSSAYLWIGKSNADYDDEYMMSYALNRGEDVTLTDLREVRSDFYKAPDNLGMYWQAPNIQAFHSVVPGSLMDFYNSSGVQRDVASRPSTNYYGLRALLSVKYLFCRSGSDSQSGDISDSDLMPGFGYLRTENGYDIYENRYYVPMGFTFDSFYSKEEYLNINEKYKHQALLNGMVLEQYQMKKYADITGYTDGMYLALNSQFDENHLQNKKYPVYKDFESITSDFEYSPENYCKDAEKLMQNTCSSFTYTKDGFEAVFENKGGDNLLFFSVPYDKGWTATVNGEPAEIEKVDIGFMAVKVKGHATSEISFTYATPMLREGVIISAAGAGLYLIYIAVSFLLRRRRGDRPRFRITYRIKKNNGDKKPRDNNQENKKSKEDNHELR